MLRGSATWSAAPFWRTSFPRRCSAPPQRATRKKRLRTRSRLCATGSTPFPSKQKSLARSHHALGLGGKRGSPQRPRRQIPRGHFRCAGLAQAQRGSRWHWQCSAEIRHQHPLHFDHTDNNAPLHAAGATVLAHENTKKRMSEPHDLPVLYRGPTVHSSTCMSPFAGRGLPQQTFRASYKLHANGETLALQHFAPAAHTDGDIYVHFEKANVIQMATCFSTGYIPTSTPVRAAQSLALLPPSTKFSRSPAMTPRLFRGTARWQQADLTKFRTCWSLRGSRSELKVRRKACPGSRRGKPFADLDPVWGKGVVNGDQWVQIVYLTL